MVSTLDVLRLGELLGHGHPKVKAMLAQVKSQQASSPVVKDFTTSKRTRLKLKDGRVLVGEEAEKYLREHGR